MVGPTIFMMSTGLVKWAPKAWRWRAAERVLEEGAEDFRVDVGPVEGGGVAEQVEFVGVEFDAGGLGEEAAVEVGDALEAAAGGLARRVHGREQAADAGRSCRSGVVQSSSRRVTKYLSSRPMSSAKRAHQASAG